MTGTSRRAFQSPYEVEAPAGAEDWRRLYPYYYLFDEERRAVDEQRFWFFDRMHNPTPVYPFDTDDAGELVRRPEPGRQPVCCEPPTRGLDQRLVNGYLYSARRE